jgi:hypothetical protein
MPWYMMCNFLKVSILVIMVDTSVRHENIIYTCGYSFESTSI